MEFCRGLLFYRLRVGVTAAAEQVESLPHINQRANQGKTGSQHTKIKDGRSPHFKEDRADGHERENRARLTRPMRPDIHGHLKMAQDAIAAEEERVAADDDRGEPDRERAQMTKRDHAERDESGEEKELIGDGIEQGPERAALVPM